MISVVMATYNGEKYLKQQLDSIAAQTILPDELIIGDDCSTDKTLEILDEFKNKVSFVVKILKFVNLSTPRSNRKSQNYLLYLHQFQFGKNLYLMHNQQNFHSF